MRIQRMCSKLHFRGVRFGVMGPCKKDPQENRIAQKSLSACLSFAERSVNELRFWLDETLFT
jgi:hypothetical protein